MSTALVNRTDLDLAVARAVDELVAVDRIASPLRPDAPRDGLDNPATLGFPPTLPLELALREQSKEEILAAYNIDARQWDRLRHNAVFVKAVRDAVEMLQREGMSFRVKARMQSEELLETSWKLIHAASTPAAVKADLIKHTHKVAGLEPKESAAVVAPLQININLG